MKLTVVHQLLPKRRSVNAAIVMDAFGIDFETGRHVVADGLELPVEPGDIVLFTGPSGSGKSSLLRAAAAKLEGVVDVCEECECVSVERMRVKKITDPPGSPPSHAPRSHPHNRILVDALPLPIGEAIALLTACGLGEPRLMLRTPAELSDGQRCRFRLAAAVARNPAWVVADEFTATLDRTLAKVVAWNVRRLADRRGCGFLVATTHEDVAADLDPDLHVSCDLDGAITWTRPRDEERVRV